MPRRYAEQRGLRLGVREIKYKLEDARDWVKDLELREKLNDNPIYVASGLGIVVFFCLMLVVCHFTGGGPRSVEVKLVYYDVSNKTIRIVKHDSIDPIASPLEGTDNVFRAHVFACKECPKGALKDGMTLAELKEQGMFIGYLERYDPQSEGQSDPDALAGGAGLSYRTLDSEEWVDENSTKIRAVLGAPANKCLEARPCRP